MDVELNMLAAALRRFFHVVVLFAAIGLVAGILLGDGAQGDAAARATILLDPDGARLPGSPNFIGDPDRYVEGELSILQSQAIATGAAERLPELSPSQVVEATSVRQRAGSSVVDVTARGATSEQARQIADAVAITYLERRSGGVSSELERRRTEIDAQLTDLEAQLEAVQGRITDDDPPPADVIARETLLRRYDQLLTIRAQLVDATLPNDRTSVIEPAVAVSSASSGPVGLRELLGLLGGAAVGVTAAVVLAAAFPRVDRRSAERILDRPAVLDLRVDAAPLGAGPSQASPKAIASVQRLAAIIAAEPADRLPRTIGVCSPLEAGVTTTIATALAGAFVGERFRVAYLSVDDHVARTPERAPGDERGGVTVLGDWELHREGPHLQVVQARWDSDDAVDGERLEDVRKLLGDDADVIVVSVPPLLESATAASVAHATDDLVLVVPVPQQPEQELELAQQVLLRSPAGRVHLVVSRQRRLPRRRPASRRPRR